MLVLSSADFFKINFFKNFFQELNSISMSNSLDPDQNRQPVGPDLGPNCLQRLSAERKERVESNNKNLLLFVCFILYIPVKNFSVMSGRIFLG